MEKHIAIKLLCSYYLVTMCTLECSGNINTGNINQYLFEQRNFDFIDLTLSLNKAFAELDEYEKVRVLQVDGYKQRYNWIEFCEKEWIGTTLDLRHKHDALFSVSQWSNNLNLNQQSKIDSLSVNRLILPLIIADMSSKVNADTNFTLMKHHLDFFLNNYFGILDQPCIIVFKFGWSKHKHDIRRYFGLISALNTILERPGISEEVAKWITTDYKNIVGVGVDLPSIDPGSTTHAAHNIFVDAGVYVVTNVDLEQFLPDAWCTALLLPLMDQGATSPVRFVAICPKSRMGQEVTPFHRL